jgi:hypothetical protein
MRRGGRISTTPCLCGRRCDPGSVAAAFSLGYLRCILSLDFVPSRAFPMLPSLPGLGLLRLSPCELGTEWPLPHSAGRVLPGGAPIPRAVYPGRPAHLHSHPMPHRHDVGSVIDRAGLHISSLIPFRLFLPRLQSISDPPAAPWTAGDAVAESLKSLPILPGGAEESPFTYRQPIPHVISPENMSGN